MLLTKAYDMNNDIAYMLSFYKNKLQNTYSILFSYSNNFANLNIQFYSVHTLVNLGKVNDL